VANNKIVAAEKTAALLGDFYTAENQQSIDQCLPAQVIKK